jgi:hypothetical protein
MRKEVFVAQRKDNILSLSKDAVAAVRSAMRSRERKGDRAA